MSPAAVAATRQMEAQRLPDWKRSYRLDEAVAATGLSRRTLYTRALEGKLRMKKDGKITLILRDDLQAFLDNLPDAGFGGS
jgi:hypothetical protein